MNQSLRPRVPPRAHPVQVKEQAPRTPPSGLGSVGGAGLSIVPAGDHACETRLSGATAPPLASMLWRADKARRGLSADTDRALANAERPRGQLALYAGFAAVETRAAGERSGVAPEEEQEGKEPRESAADRPGVGIGVVGFHDVGSRSYILRRVNALGRRRVLGRAELQRPGLYSEP